jgi:DNA-binding IclR family transcriptional regulator
VTRPGSPTVTITAGAVVGDGAPASQTLDRGLRALELVAAAAEPMTTADVARALGLHRSITYRMLRTLENRRLVDRDAAGAWLPGAGLAVLATNVVPEVRSAAQPVLEALANDTAMTAFLVIRDHDEAVTVSVVEPRSAIAHVTYRPGKRHPVHRGAPGLALLAGARAAAPSVDGQPERPEVTECRERGWAYSESEVLPGMKSVASPVLDDDGHCRAAVAVVFVGEHDLTALGAKVVAAAAEVTHRARLMSRSRPTGPA